MFHKYKKQLLISSIATLLPIVFGLLLWNRLPDTFATHWGADGQPDGWSGKGFAVFFLPLFLSALNLFCVWITDLTNRGNQQSPKVMNMIFFIVPAISLLSNGMVYANALGKSWSVTALMPATMGLLFMLIGNYLPKCTQNTTIGIKITWTLSNEENWNATHRFAGKFWFFGGVLMIFGCFLPEKWSILLTLPVVLLMALAPTLYSWLYYKKQVREGNDYPLWHKNLSKTNKKLYQGLRIFLILLFGFIAIVMFTGNISLEYGQEALTIDASFSTPLTVRYEDIASVELRSEPVDGTREMGFGSARLTTGTFKNEEFGLYTRYTYTGCDSAVVIHSVKGKVLVLAGATPEETRQIYQEILNHLGD